LGKDDKARETLQAELAIYHLLDDVFERDPTWIGWQVLYHPTYASIEMDMLVVDAADNATIVELKWGSNRESLHLGALAQVGRARDYARTLSPRTLPPTVVETAEALRAMWSGAVRAALLTNLRVSDLTKTAARDLEILLIAVATSDAEKLAQALLDHLRALPNHPVLHE
jgi:hypothetical protein